MYESLMEGVVMTTTGVAELERRDHVPMVMGWCTLCAGWYVRGKHGERLVPGKEPEWKHDQTWVHQRAVMSYERIMGLRSEAAKWNQAIEAGWVSNYQWPWI